MAKVVEYLLFVKSMFRFHTRNTLNKCFHHTFLQVKADGYWYEIDVYLSLQWITSKNLHTPYLSV